MRFACLLGVVGAVGCNQILGNGNLAGPPGDGQAVGPADACIGMQCQVANCAAMGLPPTSISGIVFAPNGTLPLYGVTVYAPNADPGPLPSTLGCNRCGDPLPGEPITRTTTDEAGHFSLENVPTGADISVVITTGKWRRILKIPQVASCADLALSAKDTTLPTSRTDVSPYTTSVDLPRIAVTTGAADALECLVRKLGIADSEITTDAQGGRVHLYSDTGTNAFATGSTGGTGAFSNATTLWGDPAKLATYDVVLFSCDGNTATSTPPAAVAAVKQYADTGGRLFMSHFHNIWIKAAWPQVATFNNQASIFGTYVDTIDEATNPKGPSFATWMLNVGGSTTRGQITLDPNTGRNTVVTADSTKVQQWVYWPNGGTDFPQNFHFTTPNEEVPASRCGKVGFSDMHVSDDSASRPALPYPTGCSTAALSAQEKALAFLLFDLQGCVGP